jgi:REP element-mobilizing transposase RayT
VLAAQSRTRPALERNTEEFKLQASIIMPNHVHILVDVWDVPLAKLINRWKGRTSRMANLRLGRSGKFWQQDYFDTVIRHEQHLRKAIHYTEWNPAKAVF